MSARQELVELDRDKPRLSGRVWAALFAWAAMWPIGIGWAIWERM